MEMSRSQGALNDINMCNIDFEMAKDQAPALTSVALTEPFCPSTTIHHEETRLKDEGGLRLGASARFTPYTATFRLLASQAHAHEIPSVLVVRISFSHYCMTLDEGQNQADMLQHPPDAKHLNRRNGRRTSR